MLIELFSGWISLLVRVVNPELQPTQIMNYVADNYAFSGLKGLIIIGIASLAMSTADSCINSAAVLFANDISKTLPDNETQYRFPYPEEPTIDVIIRQDGYYLTRLPKHLQGQVKKDSKTGLFPVKLSTSISKINKYYDQAAELGKVKEEPVHAL